MSVVSVTSPNQNTRVYTNSDETTFTKTGGDPVWRNNNPGDLAFTTFAAAQTYGAIGEDPNGFAIFPTEVWGAIATEAVILNNYSTNSINYMVEKYAPSFENNTTQYQAFLTDAMGVPGTTVISALSDSQFATLVDQIFTEEGNDPDGALTGAVPSGGLIEQAHYWLIRQSANALSQFGYYVTLPADGSTTTAVASAIAAQDLNDVSLSGTTLQSINAVFGDSGSATGGKSIFSTGSLVHIPVSEVALSSTLTSFSAPSGDFTAIVDPTSSALYAVGSSLDNHDAGALVIDNDVDVGGGSSTFTTFAAGTYSGASVSGGNASIELTAPGGGVLGTYDTDPSFTFADGLTISMSSGAGDQVGAAPSTDTPEQALVFYLGDLGYNTSASALDALDIAYLNPTGTHYSVTGTVVANPGNTSATVTYTTGSTPGAQVTGSSTAVITVSGNPETVSATNILAASGDLTQDSVTGMQELDATGALALTAAEFNAFPTIIGSGALTITSAGTVSLAASGDTGTFTSLTAEDWGGTNLTGSSTNGQTLTASTFGTDVLTAGNGTGDSLYAGEGKDTITGGSGGDTFYVNNGLAANSSITGNGTGNTLVVAYGGDISGATTITGVQTLHTSSVTLNASELLGFTSISDGGTLILNAKGAGTYNVGSKAASGDRLSLSTDAADSITMMGNDTAYDSANAANSSGTDNLTLGNGAYDTLTAAGSTGGDYLTAGNGGNDTLIADNSSGGDHLTVNDTSYGSNALSAQNSSGNNTLTAGNGSADILIVDGSSGNNTLTVGSGGGDILSANNTSGNNKLIATTGYSGFLYAENSTGNNTLTAGIGGDTLDDYGSTGSDTLNGGTGSDTFIAGSGIETLNGGVNGGDKFEVDSGLAAGSSITGHGTGNTLELNTSGSENISGATISGIQSTEFLEFGTVTVNAGEMAAFGTLDNLSNSTIVASGSGTFSLLSAVATSSYVTLIADPTANDTLISGDFGDEWLEANNTSGNDTLEASFGGTTLSVQGSTGTDQLLAGSTDYDSFYAGLGDDTLNGGTGYVDSFYFTSKAGAGTTVTGGSGGFYDSDIVYAETTDISAATITNVPVLYDYSSTLTLSGAEFNQFTILDNEGSATETLVVVGTGSYSLSGKVGSGTFNLITDSGSSITGDNTTGQALYAPSTGTSTVTAGSGAGDYLYAGGGTDTLNAGSGGDTLVAGTGTDTLTGGSGNDTFVVGNTLAADTINGAGGTNLMQITASGASIASATISNITSLEIENGASTTLTHTQFGGFTTYTADTGAGAVKLSGAGTYSLASDTVTGALILDASGSTGNFTLTGNNTAYQTINGSTGSSSTDTIATGTGTEDTVNANGKNDFVTLNGTYGTANINDASGAWTNVNGANDLVNDSGSGDTIYASGANAWINSNGGSQSITTTGASTYDTVNINGSSTWANITGSNDTINADGSYDNVTLNGSTDWVYINASHVTVALDGSSGNVTAVTGASSTNAWINMNANNNVVTLDGTNGSATASAGYSNDWINVNGTGNVATLSGTNDTAYLTGAAEDAWVNVGGSGNGTNGSGTGNTFNITGSSNTVCGGDDTFIVANGLSDTLNGGESDIYELGSTFGNITINNTDFGNETTANGKLTFGSGVSDTNLWFQQSGNNLLIDLLGSSDQITVDNWFGSNAGAQLSEIDAGSLKLTTATQVQALVSAMATYSANNLGFNPQASGATMPSALTTTLTANWHS